MYILPNQDLWDEQICTSTHDLQNASTEEKIKGFIILVVIWLKVFEGTIIWRAGAYLEHNNVLWSFYFAYWKLYINTVQMKKALVVKHV